MVLPRLLTPQIQLRSNRLDLDSIEPRRPLLTAAFFIWFFVYVPYSPEITGLTPTRLYLETLVFLALAAAMLLSDRNPQRLDGGGLILLVPIAYYLSLFFVADNTFAKSAFLSAASIFFTLFALAVVLGGRDLSRPADWISSGLIAISLAVITQIFGDLGTYSLSIPGLPVLEFGSPHHFGGFGQRNVMASFVACLVTWSVAECLSRSDRQVSHFQLIALAVGAFVVTVSASKIGILGLAVGGASALVWLRFISSMPVNRSTYRLFGAVIMGVLVGSLVANVEGRPTGLDRFATEMTVDDSGIVLGSSFTTRINAWYSALITWWSNPLVGEGPGSFLHGFQDLALQGQLPLSEQPQVFKFFHSHSMLLQALADGGLVRVVLTVMPLAIWFFLVLRSWTACLLGMVALSPILLHSLTEYPFETSGLHWLLVGVIPLSLREPLGSDRVAHPTPTIGSRLLLPCLIVSCITVGYLQLTSQRAVTDLNVLKGINNELLTNWYAGDERVVAAMSHPIVGPYATQLVYQEASVVLSRSSEKASLEVMQPFAQDALEFFPSRNAYELYLITATENKGPMVTQIAQKYERLKNF